MFGPLEILDLVRVGFSMEKVSPVMEVENPKTIGQDQPKKLNKRKREPAAIENLSSEEKEAQISSLKQETDGLFEYFREMIGQTQTTDLFLGLSDFSSVNSMVALLMEEMSVPLSKLVDEIFVKLKEKMETVTIAAVKSAVVSVGQRVSYGVPNADADVLEDDTESCLWCWEVKLYAFFFYSYVISVEVMGLTPLGRNGFYCASN